MDSGEEEVTDSAVAEALRKKGRGITVKAVAIAIVLTVLGVIFHLVIRGR